MLAPNRSKHSPVFTAILEHCYKQCRFSTVGVPARKFQCIRAGKLVFRNSIASECGRCAARQDMLFARTVGCYKERERTTIQWQRDVDAVIVTTGSSIKRSELNTIISRFDAPPSVFAQPDKSEFSHSRGTSEQRRFFTTTETA